MQKETTHKSEKQVFSVVKRAKSFTYAINGIRLFLKTTHNSWIQIFLAIVAIILGVHFHIETTEWLFIILSIGFVLAAVAFNTAFEFDMDLTSPRLHPYAKYTKDVAAGAVLIASITALCIGLIIFLPKIFFSI